LAETKALPEISRTGVEQQPGGEFYAADRNRRKNWIHVASPQAGPKIAAILSVVESRRRLKLPVRDYLGAALPGLSDRPIQRLSDRTPAAWVAQHS